MSALRVVYLDSLFLLNGAIDYLLFLAAARLAGEPLRRLRFGLAAALGGLYAALLFVPELGFLGELPCRLACGALMLLTAFGESRRLCRQWVIFLALTLAFGGGVAALGMLNGQTTGFGVCYMPPDIKLILLSGAAWYALLTLTLSRLAQHTAVDGELVPVKVHLRDRAVKLTALVDTGNTLTDPAAGTPVMVAEGFSLSALFPPEARPEPSDLLDPVAGLARLGTGEWRSRFRLLPFRSVGVSRGLLLAVRVDGVEVNGEEQPARLVALSPTPVSDGGRYCALVSPAPNTALCGEKL